MAFAFLLAMTSACTRPRVAELDPYVMAKLEAAGSPPKIPEHEILYEQTLNINGEDMQCVLFESSGKIHVRIGSKEFRILGTNKEDGTPVEFTPELVHAARNSCALSSTPDGIIALSITIPFFLAGNFSVEKQQVAASLASLHDNSQIHTELFIIVSDGSIRIPLCKERTYSGTLCVLRVEEVGGENFLAQR